MNSMDSFWLARFVRIKESLFALPWVLSAALLPFTQPGFASSFPWHRWELWPLIILAFISARVAGMSFNRIIDRKIDAANARTMNRMLPQGEVSVLQASIVAWTAAAIFIISCAFINTLCFILSPIALFLIILYSYTKRFTSYSHIVLGMVQFWPPFFAWAAVTGTWNVVPVLLGFSLMNSIAGNDIIYSLQDIAFDRKMGLHSIPVAYGEKNALKIAMWLHISTVIFLFVIGSLLRLPYIYFIGLGIISTFYMTSHQSIRLDNPDTINAAFYKCNTQVAIAYFLTTLGTLLWLAIS